MVNLTCLLLISIVRRSTIEACSDPCLVQCLENKQVNKEEMYTMYIYIYVVLKGK